MLLCLVTSILVQAVFANGTQSLSGKRTQEESDTILNSLREIAKSLEGRTDDDIAKVPRLASSVLVFLVCRGCVYIVFI